MYRRRRNSSLSFLWLIVIGVIAGVIYLVIDNWPDQSGLDQPLPTFVPTRIAQVEAATPEPTAETEASLVSDGTPAGIDAFTPAIPEDAAIFIPSAGIYARIVQAYLDGQSWDVSRLGQNVGHLQGTSWLTEGGNIVLSGHVELADGRTGIFANLHQVAPGDVIVMTMNGNEWRYMVTEVRITEPNDLEPLYPTIEERLTLITCGAYDFFQDSYLERTVVVAERLG